MLALEDRDRSKDRPRGRRPMESGPPIALGDRAASSSGSRSARRPETLEEKRARLKGEYQRGYERTREGPDQDTRAQSNRSHARRVREQQFISAVQG